MSIEKKESILAAEEIYRNMFLNAQIGLFRTEISTGLLLDANDCLARFLGFADRREVMAKPINIAERYVDPQDRQRMVHMLREYGEFDNFEARFKRNDGSITWIRSSSRLVPPKGWIEGVAEDITKEKDMEESLRNSEEKYRQLVENSHDIIFSTSADGLFTFVSPAWTALLGHPLSQVVGHPFQPFIHPDDLAQCMSWMQQMRATGQRLDCFEYRVRHADGSWRWHTSSAVSLRDEAGAVVGFEGTARDVTESKRAEEALAREKFLLQVLMNNVPDYVYFKDRDSRFIRINKAHAQSFGLHDPAQAAGKTDFDFFTEEHARQAFEDEQAIMRTGHPVSKEERETWADRPDTWVLTTKMPLHDEKGDLIGTFGISKDITARKQAEEEIKRQLAEKEILLREVHHRIKNNIASIGGLLSLHLKSVTHPEAVAVLQDAIGRIDSMRILYDKLMLSEGYKDVSVKKYAESLADMVVTLFPGGARIAVEKRIADFHLDAKRLFPLGIIINELLTNKMKYAFIDREAGLIAISLAKEGGHVTLSIEDDGPGLPDGFDVHEAKGFGLALVEMLSRQLGGSFAMEKRAGTRCTLEFTI
jgi:PAS domain S-box-containing protein